MKFPFLPAVLALLALGSSLHADLVVVQRMTGPMTMDVTMKIKGSQMRVESGTTAIMLMNFDTGDSVTLIPAQKMAMKMTAAQAKKSMEAASKAQGETPRPVFSPTGKTETIGGYPADEYTVSMAGMSMHYWFSKTYPNAAAFRDVMVKMMESTFSKMAMATNMTPAKFPDGVPVKTEMAMGGQSITTTLVSVTETNVPATDFVVPTDYKEMAMPQMPQAPPAAP